MPGDLTPSPSLPETLQRARLRLLDLHYTAKHGHLGGNLSCLDGLVTLFHEVLKPEDSLILSKGHSAGALYVTLWSQGLLTEDDLATFTKDDTRLAVHPPVKGIPAIPFGTGSLGHGTSLAAGLAMARKLKGEPGRIFCLCGDGEWQEGSCWEALTFAVRNRLDTLCIVVDVNKWQGFGNTEDVADSSLAKLQTQMEAFGARVVHGHGHGATALQAVLTTPPVEGRPTVILLDTVKGHGLSFFANTLKCHYLPLTDEQYQQGKAELEADDAR